MSGLLVSYYGDDFTGSTDALEAFASNGLETVLFLRPPEVGLLERFRDCRVLGLAGVSRSKSPAWMSENLPGVFGSLRDLGAPFCHYKVCSTFDSSPETGSIGRALEIGQATFGCRFVPVVVGAPSLGRYVLFGNLFARAGDATYRIDRHPAMSRHPVTPMTESDLRVHLGRQTAQRIGLVDLNALRDGEASRRLDALLDDGTEVVVFDGLDEASLAAIGRVVWAQCVQGPLFAVGSSGLDYALIAHWRTEGRLPPKPEFADPGPAERLVVVSGSCSPMTERQIRWALANGFAGVRVDPLGIDGVRGEALAGLREGRGIVLYTALGPQDRRDGAYGESLGARLGVLLRELLQSSGVRRAVVAGGDTASHAGQQLGLYALGLRKPLDPGTPMCRGYSSDPKLDGLELVFKGGQVGAEDFFGIVQRGKR